MTTPRKPRPHPPHDAILWTEQETAAALHTQVAKLDRARLAGHLTGVRIEDGPWLYRPADVQAYVDRLANATAAPAGVWEMPRPRKQRTG